MSKTLIWGHQGMGDHLICNGLYRAWAEREPITVCCIQSVARNVSHMLSDVMNIEVAVWPDEDHMNRLLLGTPGLVRVGSQQCGLDYWFAHWNSIFDIAFYEQHKFPFTLRWEKWFVPVYPQMPLTHPSFVHEKSDRPLAVEGMRPDPDISLFAYIQAMQAAEEIHCANSCFAAMADSYPLDGKRLFFYRDGRPVPQHKNKWTYVD